MVTRGIDDLGRIVLPYDYRRKLRLKDKSVLEVTLRNGEIVLKPINLEHFCTVCEQEKEEELSAVNQKVRICHDCLKKIKDIMESSEE